MARWRSPPEWRCAAIGGSAAYRFTVLVTGYGRGKLVAGTSCLPPSVGAPVRRCPHGIELAVWKVTNRARSSRSRAGVDTGAGCDDYAARDRALSPTLSIRPGRSDGLGARLARGEG